MFAELLQTSNMIQSLIQYLGGACSASQLEDWLLQNLQDILDSGDTEAIHIANDIDALFVELSEGLISEDQLKDRISAFLAQKRPQLVRDCVSATNDVILSEPISLVSSTVIQVRHSFV